jgi:hypothetical protein
MPLLAASCCPVSTLSQHRWQQNKKGKKSPKSWPQSLDPRILTPETWPQSLDPRVLTQESWPKNLDPRILTPESWPNSVDPSSSGNRNRQHDVPRLRRGQRPDAKERVGSETRGQCYDHNFLRFLTVFAEKMAFSLKNNVMIKFLHNLALFRVKNANFFAEFFGKNI